MTVREGVFFNRASNTLKFESRFASSGQSGFLVPESCEGHAVYDVILLQHNLG